MMRCYIDWEDADVDYGVMSVFMTGQGYLLGTVNVVNDVKFAYKLLQCKMFGSLSQIIIHSQKDVVCCSLSTT